MRESARVNAVKAFAAEHGKEDEKWAKVGEMSDLDIYNIVKHTQSENGAIRKIARRIGSELGADLQFHAPTQTTAQAEAERKLLELVGAPDKVTGANAYDNPQGHAGHAPEIRPEVAREAIRSTANAGRPLPEELQSHEGQPDEVKEAVEPKKSSGTKASSGARAGNGGKEPNH